MESILFYVVFLIPGYFSYLIVKLFKLGFGKKADSFDKTICSLLFDVPIFLLTINLINNPIMNSFLLINQQYTVIYTIQQFQDLFINNVSSFFRLIIVVLVISLIVGLLWILLITLIIGLYNKIFEREIFIYSSIWHKRFNLPDSSMPVQIYRENSVEPFVQGFIKEVSSTLDDDMEFEVIESDLFTLCRGNGLINEIEYIYFNASKNIKVIVYKKDGISRYLHENSVMGGNQNG